MFKEINQDELEEYQRLSEEEKALIIEGSSIIDRRAWNKRISNIKYLYREIDQLTDDIWGHIDNIDNMDPSAPESSKTATIKIINQKNEQKEKLLQRVNYQVNSMVMTCIHPPEQCIKNENGTFLCTFCQKNFALRVPIEK